MTGKVIHSISPIYDKNSKILILGTIPSPKSREAAFYYSHPQNRFWAVMSEIFGKDKPSGNKEKTDFLIENNIALWDVLKSCDIKGADDSSIKNPIPNNINIILDNADINAVFTTGKKATALYKRHIQDSARTESIYLPSTSPANCRQYTYEQLVNAYRIILEYI